MANIPTSDGTRVEQCPKCALGTMGAPSYCLANYGRDDCEYPDSESLGWEHLHRKCNVCNYISSVITTEGQSKKAHSLLKSENRRAEARARRAARLLEKAASEADIEERKRVHAELKLVRESKLPREVREALIHKGFETGRQVESTNDEELLAKVAYIGTTMLGWIRAIYPYNASVARVERWLTEGASDG